MILIFFVIGLEGLISSERSLSKAGVLEYLDRTTLFRALSVVLVFFLWRQIPANSPF